MKKIEFDDVYLEIPDELVKEEKSNKELVISESRTVKLSLEELQKRLEETQALHL